MGRVPAISAARVFFVMPFAVVLSPFVLGSVGPMQLRMIDLVFSGALGLAMVTETHKPQRELAIPLMAAFALIIAVALVGEIGVEGHETDWPSFARLLQGLTWAFAAAVLLRTRKQLRLLVLGIATGGALMAALSIAIFIGNDRLHRIAGLWLSGDGTTTALQFSFNEVGAIHALAFSLALVRFLSGPQEGLAGRFAIGALLVGNLAGCLLTQSRSGMVALGIGALVAVILNVRAGSGVRRDFTTPTSRILPLTAALAGVVVWLSSQLALNRVARTFLVDSHERFTALTRFNAWQVGMEAWMASWTSFLFGHGNDGFARLVGSSTSENYWLDRAVAGGLVTLLICIALYALPGLWALREARRVGATPEVSNVLVASAVIGAVSMSGNVVADPGLAAIALSVLYGSYAVANLEAAGKLWRSPWSR